MTLKPFLTEFRDLIREEIGKRQYAQLAVVTGVNAETYTVQVKSSVRAIQYDNVPLLGLGLGNQRGVATLPKVDDWVMLIFLGGNNTTPFVAGTVYDSFSQTPDNLPPLEEGALLVTVQEGGTFVYLAPNGDYIVRTKGSNGYTNGSRFRLNTDGSFKIQNGGGYGLECDSAGNVTIRGVTVNATQTPGTWP